MIEINNLHKSFNGKPVLTGVDLIIPDGESITIIGRSGCGKSVLLKHIIGLLKPDRGSIVVDGEKVTIMDYESLSRLRRKFGVLFQGSALFDSMTVKENIAISLVEHTDMSQSEIDRQVAEALDMVELPGAENLKPSELSGGMKKRVGLARAIIYRPAYLLYDEPTTGLDPIMAANINQLIIGLNQKLSITSIVVTHDIVSAYEVADRIVMLHYGKILFSGTPEETIKVEHPTVKQFVEGSVEGPIKPLHYDHMKSIISK